MSIAGFLTSTTMDDSDIISVCNLACRFIGREHLSGPHQFSHKLVAVILQQTVKRGASAASRIENLGPAPGGIESFCGPFIVVPFDLMIDDTLKEVFF